MSTRRTAEKLEELFLWHREHQRETSSIEMRVKFLEKCLDEMITMFSYVVETLNDLEGRPPEALGKRLYTPTGISFSGSLKHFG